MLTIDEIEIFFETFGYPDTTIEIRPGMKVHPEDSKKFVDNSISCLRSNPGKLKTYGMYYDHLLKYYQIVKWNK